MTKDQFRALEEISGNRNPSNSQAKKSKADDLLAAAISAFAGLTRPGRHDMQQLEDLVTPLLQCATPRGKRHAANALAQVEEAPRQVVLALAHEPVEISAPLLLRSPLLRPGDLIDLIGKNGLPHARAIARRQSGDTLLQSVLRSFADPVIDRTLTLQEKLANIESDPLDASALSSSQNLVHGFDHLIDMALQADRQFFRRMLADILDLSIEQTEIIIGQWPGSPLPIALNALGLSGAECFLVMTAVLGTVKTDRAGLQAFVQFYNSIDPEKSMVIIRRWKAEDMSAMLRGKLREMAQFANDAPASHPAPLLDRLAK